MTRMLSLIPALVLLPALALAQTEGPGKSGTIPNSHASYIAKAKIAAAIARRATHVVGEAVGLDNLPVAVCTPAPAASDHTAKPHPGECPATPATLAPPTSVPPHHAPLC